MKGPAMKGPAMKALVRKFSRYATVSAISTSVTLTVLGALVYSRGLSAGWANVIATAAGTVPSFGMVTLISQAANVSTFGALWVVQYVLLDRLLFGSGHRGRAGRPLPAVTPLGADPATRLERAA